MGDTRGARCSDNDKVLISVDGVPLTGLRKDEGCLGDVHIFSAATTLAEPVTYAWYIDSIQTPPISIKQTCAYTFDDKEHKLISLVSNTKCAIGTTIGVKGYGCVDCAIQCAQQTAFFPAGELKYLFDTTGKYHLIQGTIVTECKTPSRTNALGAKSIARTARMVTRCRSIVNAQLFYNRSSPNCLTLNITNSPTKFQSIQIGNTKYPFTGC